MEGAEVPRHLGRHGTKRVAQAVLIAAVPLMLRAARCLSNRWRRAIAPWTSAARSKRCYSRSAARDERLY